MKQAPAEDFLYIRVADGIEQQIRRQVLRTGDKLLSVRALSRELGVSMSTAFNAYAHLEIRGLIEARPKSGYYVRFMPRPSVAAVPPAADEETGGSNISVDRMIAQVYEHISREGIVRLSIAVPALELLPRAKLNKALAEAVRQSADSCIGYEDIQGNARLRQQIARYTPNGQQPVTAADVVTTHGCMEALVYALKAVTRPGDTVAIQSPTYFGIFTVMLSLGLKVLEIPAGQQGVRTDYLAKRIRDTKISACLFVPTFNNPTGGSMPDAEKKHLVQLLAKHRIPLIEDDIYGELYFGRTRPRTCKSYDEEGLVLLCSSISKALAPGYRVGWCIPGRFREQVISQKLMHSVSSTTPTHAAIGLFFETGRFDLHMRHLRKALHTQCLRYMQAIAAYFPPDTAISQPEGGYVLWIGLNRKVDAFRLFRNAMAEHISIAPGQLFSTDARFGNYIRISFGRPYDQTIDRSLKRLGELVRELAG